MKDFSSVEFIAHTIHGEGRGKGLGTPTVNLSLDDVPGELEEGIYACRVFIDEKDTPLDAAMHYGPRPVFHAGPACEVHILDRNLDFFPKLMKVQVMGRIRAIENFSSSGALREAIARDIAATRGILHPPSDAAPDQSRDRAQKPSSPPLA